MQMYCTVTTRTLSVSNHTSITLSRAQWQHELTRSPERRCDHGRNTYYAVFTRNVQREVVLGNE